MQQYIHLLPGWPSLRYDSSRLLKPLEEATHRLGLLVGRLEGMGFGDIQDTTLEAISREVVTSSEIEGERLDMNLVRSSVARRLGLETAGVPTGDHRVEGVVEMAIDAAQNWSKPLTKERLFHWHAALFPEGRSSFQRIKVGDWRDHEMSIVSGPVGHERVHYIAPDPERVDQEMTHFLTWFESDAEPSGILKAGLAHLWFETIHPFDDGNGRIGRAIMDMTLARTEQRTWRSYSMSSQIQKERNAYYDALQQTQHGTLDVTPWMEWYLGCLARALESSIQTISGAIGRTRFWQTHANKSLNERQRKVLSKMLMGFEGKLTNKKWQKLTHASPRTALRDLSELVEMGILQEDEAGGRSTSYSLILP